MIDRSKWTREREKKLTKNYYRQQQRDTEVANKIRKKISFLINGQIFRFDSHFYDDLMML